MYTVQTLIDAAIVKCGTQAALARRLGMERQDVHAMARGARPVTPTTVALLCDVLELPGVEAQRLAALAVVQNAKDSSLREVLRRAFFGLWALCAPAVLTLPTTDAQASNGDTTSTVRNGPFPPRWFRLRNLCSRLGLLRLMPA